MRRLIGTGTTDANGNVTVTYTGSGAGKVQLMAECGTIQSETYNIIDSLFRDGGVDGDAKENSSYSIIRGTRSVGENGTTFSATDSYAHLILISNNTRYNLPFGFEFDLLETSASARVNIMDGETNVQSYFNTINPGHIVITVTEDGVTAKCDGTNISHSSTLPTHASRLGLYIGDTGDSMKYKNLIIYPL